MKKKYIIIAVILLVFTVIATFAVTKCPRVRSILFDSKEEKAIQHTNAEITDLIEVYEPKIGDWIRNPLVIKGKARGTWFFEGDFPIVLENADGEEFASGYATAQGEWMTEEFVEFQAEIKVPVSDNEAGKLILKKDNPSGLPEHDNQLSVDIVYASVYTKGECSKDDECELPFDYAIRSCCPFKARCYEGKCIVHCPEF